MRIAIINPNTTVSITDRLVRDARRVARPDTDIVGVTARRGAPSIESHVEEVFGAAAVIDAVREHRAEVDAFVVACFGDTGVHAAREMTDRPVIGMTEAALVTASMLATTFAVVTLPPRTLEHSRRVLRETGLGHRALLSALEIDVADIAQTAAAEEDAFFTEGLRAERAGAEALVLGCAGLGEIAAPLAERLGIPVVDGVRAAVVHAEAMLALGLRTSKASTYAPPTTETIHERSSS